MDKVYLRTTAELFEEDLGVKLSTDNKVTISTFDSATGMAYSVTTDLTQLMKLIANVRVAIESFNDKNVR